MILVPQHSVCLARTSLPISKESYFGSIKHLLNQWLNIVHVQLFITSLVVIAVVKQKLMFFQVFGQIHLGLHFFQHQFFMVKYFHYILFSSTTLFLVQWPFSYQYLYFGQILIIFHHLLLDRVVELQFFDFHQN